MIYQFIDENKNIFGLRWLFKHFNMAPNAYYNYLKGNKDAYCKQKQKILEEIFPNLLKQNFTADAKNKVWCTDFTYIRLANGKMRYNCTIIDLYDRCAVASLDSSYINTELAMDTLKRAIKNEKPDSGLILHSDQGCQFTSWTFVDFCKSQGIVQSMSKAGCPYDNAPMERFYKTFKDELIYRYRFINAKALDDAVAQYVFVWYNQIGPHSYNNWMTPFEARNM